MGSAAFQGGGLTKWWILKVDGVIYLKDLEMGLRQP